MAAGAQHYQTFRLADAPLDEGTALLEASAGTGKTYTLTGILVRMLLEDVVEHVEQALVVTFTVAAANELKNRLRAAIALAHDVCLGKKVDDPFFAGLAKHGKKGANKLRRALDEFDQASVMTIHGFCKRLLDEAAFESNEPFDLEFAVDETPLWLAAAADALRLVRAHDGVMLGVVLHDVGLDPDELVKLYRGWQRHPDTALTPAEPQLAVCLANLRAAVCAAASMWDDELLERVARFPWPKRKGPGNGNVRRHLQQVTRHLAEQPDRCLPLFASLAPSVLLPKLNKTGRPTLDHPFFATCEEVLAEYQRTREHLHSELLLHMHRRLDRHKHERALLTFDDLLQRTHRAVTDPEREQELLRALQDRYSVALIDEFQDTDARQYEILSRCFANRPVFLVGDPKQSIYAFRGADLRTYLKAVDDALSRNTLGVNFRSSQQLVDAVHHLFARPGTFVEPDIRMHKVRANAGPQQLLVEDDELPAMRFRTLPIELSSKGSVAPISADDARRRIADDVTDEIERLLRGDARIDGRAVLPRDIAVLTRRNLEAVLVQEKLRERGVVSVIGKAGDVFETEELVELERLLLAIQRPNDLLRARAALTTRIWGYDAQRLAALEHDDDALEAELANLERWRQLWVRRGFVVMKEQLLRDLSADVRMLRRRDGERRLTNLNQLCEMLHQAEHDHRLSPEGLLHWLQHERSHKEDIDYQRRELRLESDEDAVQILTMHGSKGLQYEIVFCPFLWDGRPAPKSNTALDVMQGGEPTGDRQFALETDEDDDAWRKLEADRVAEDVRLAYVALTRAKRRCYVHWGGFGSFQSGFWCSALAWMLHPTGVDTHKRDWPKTWGKAYRDGATELREQLDRVVAASGGTICVEHLDGAERARPLRSAPPPDDHAAPSAAGAPAAEGAPDRHLPRRAPLLVHSFSSLVSQAAPDGSAHDVRDPQAAGANDDGSQAPGDGIFGFARGAEAGQCLHTILEHLDWRAIDDDRTRGLIERTLQHHGLAAPDAHPGDDIRPVDVVQQNLRDLAAARLHEGGPRYGEVCQGPGIAEWQFTLPIGRPDLRALARCFADSDSEVARAYAPRLAQIDTRQLRGFLTGFVDQVSEHDGRFWIIDWKSNHLGDAVADYDDDALQHAMRSHDYVLQYHLYVLAWHLHMQARVPDYDYERHFAGVGYAFLRGAVPDTDNGMFHDRPSRALVEQLAQWARGGLS